MNKRIFLTVSIVVNFINAYSQLCTGSLGDPLVNISFGSGSNPGPALAAAATGYQFVSGDCPGDGFYSVRNNTSACFGNTWHTLNADHTGNNNGYFMLVNASLQPSAFYVDTVKGLCGGSTYEFAAWIMNVILPSSCNGNSNQPNLTFTIERTNGTILQTYNSNNIPPTPAPTWKQYGFFFTTPAGVSDIVLRIVNNAPGGCGNDLALDDITFRPCGPQLTPAVAGQPGTSANLCEGIATTYTYSCTVSAGFNTPVFQWQQRFNNSTWTDIAGANTTTYINNVLSNAPLGIYEYRLTVAEAGNIASPQCRISSLPIRLTINANPVASAINNGPVCEGTTIQLTSTGGTQYNWTGPNGYAASGASVTILNTSQTQAGSYNVLVTNAAGCIANAATNIIVQPAPLVIVAFPDTAICIKDSIMLIAAGAPNFQWIPAAGLSAAGVATPNASPAVPTIYTVIGTNAAGCKDSATIDVNVYNKAIANAGPDKTIISGGAATLSAVIEGDYLSFSWTASPDIADPTVLQPVVSPLADATYQLNVASKNGCGSSSDQVNVNFYTGIFIPNTFTPNNDGRNDTWNIPALDAYPGFQLKVFNRYGQAIFENNHLNQPWNGSFKGQPLEMGAYIYFIRLNNELPVLKGTVIIMR
ncbi:MAG: gliding motility-associated C-terminal domain-containing protein [Rhizobacter sp.]|nr:gliding motility-associated C-terminal domain-containing protein [Ferruginibacter sp.]